jgi:hypothetical protein
MRALSCHAQTLDGNGIGPNAFVAIARALRGNSSLVRLSVRACGLKSDSVVKFADKLRTAPVRAVCWM